MIFCGTICGQSSDYHQKDGPGNGVNKEFRGLLMLVNSC